MSLLRRRDWSGCLVLQPPRLLAIPHRGTDGREIPLGLCVLLARVRGGWYDTLVCFGLQLVAPSGRSPLTALPLNPFPPQAVVPIGLSPPLCPSSPSLAYLSLSTSLSFPSGGCANGDPGLSLFHCSVSGPHRGGQLPLPLAGSKRAPNTSGGEPLPNSGVLGPRMSTCGDNSPMGAHNNFLPVHPCAQSSLWRAHHALVTDAVGGGGGQAGPQGAEAGGGGQSNSGAADARQNRRHDVRSDTLRRAATRHRWVLLSVKHPLRAAPPSPRPLQGTQPTPSHCPPDGKCELQWHL